jgi:transcriptional regulator with XRE-family HTH domain
MSRDFIHHSERLKKIRQKDLHLSQQELANQLGVPVHRIKDIEIGKAKISVDLALLIEEKFHFDFRWLLTGEGTMTSADSSSPSAKLRSIDSRALQQIIQTVEERATQAGITLGAAKKARLIVLLWEYSVETGKGIEPEMVDKYLELVV